MECWEAAVIFGNAVLVGTMLMIALLGTMAKLGWF